MTALRIGHGYDVHRLTAGRKLILGGVEISWEKGLLGHSDADVLLLYQPGAFGWGISGSCFLTRTRLIRASPV